MKSESDGLRLRIFVHEALRHKGKYVYEAIVEHARREGMAGAVVFRGIEGYGLHRHLQTSRLVDVSDNLPMVVEIVDAPAAIQRFVETLDAFVPHGYATLSPLHITTYSTGRAP